MISMKTKIPLALDSGLLNEAATLTAEEGVSLGALLVALLERVVHKGSAYKRARKRALARLREGMGLRWTPPHSRDELHER